MLIGRYRNEDRYPAIDLLGIENGNPAYDDVIFLHLLDSTPTGSCRQPDPFGYIGDRKRCVLLDQAQDHFVDTVHRLCQFLQKNIPDILN
jgi:hypothetical protein